MCNDKEGIIISHNRGILTAWREHFKEPLNEGINEDPDEDNDAPDTIEQKQNNINKDSFEHTYEETYNGINTLEKQSTRLRYNLQ